MNLFEKSALELNQMLKNKKCSAVEITNSVFDRIDKVEAKVNSYITLEKEKALIQAKKVDEKIAKDEQISDLAGIPIGVKDNICTKGILTTCASKMLYNFVPPYDATVVEKIKNNDMIITGKVNMDEFAMGSSTETSYYKKTANPHNLSCVSGGSSGGSASCVAAGEAIVSIGSDTGGSVRQPASFNGIVGLKPTYGAVSRYGLVAFASSLDQIGPMGRTTKDVAMLYSVLCGKDDKDATSVEVKNKDFLNNINSDIKGLKVGLPKEYFGEGVDPKVKQAILDLAKILELNGAIIKETSLENTKYALNAYYIISSAEASSNLARFDGVKYGYRTENYKTLTEMYENTRSEGFGDEVKRRILLGTFVLSSGYYDAYYKKAKLIQKNIVSEFDNAFNEFDVLLTPTSPMTAFKLGENINDPVKMYANDICTVTINIAGLPALNIPCGFDDKGLPIGAQLIGRKFDEQTLFNVAQCYENQVCGFNKIPEIK